MATYQTCEDCGQQVRDWTYTDKLRCNECWHRSRHHPRCRATLPARSNMPEQVHTGPCEILVYSPTFGLQTAYRMGWNDANGVPQWITWRGDQQMGRDDEQTVIRFQVFPHCAHCEPCHMEYHPRPCSYILASGQSCGGSWRVGVLS